MSRRRILREYPGRGPYHVVTMRHEPGLWRIVRSDGIRWRETPPGRVYPTRYSAWLMARRLTDEP